MDFQKLKNEVLDDITEFATKTLLKVTEDNEIDLGKDNKDFSFGELHAVLMRTNILVSAEATTRILEKYHEQLQN